MIGDTSLSFSEFQKTHKATISILKERPKSHAFFDFAQRAPLAKSAYSKWKRGFKPTRDEKKAYLTNAILPHHALDITSEEFDTLLKVYGDSIVRLAIVDDSLHQYIHARSSAPMILSTGGACALETVDTKIIDILESRGDNANIVRYIDEVFSAFPTWTQITGALLPAKGLNVLYDETFPWYLKIDEHGVPNPRLVTQRVYDQVFVAVERFVKLHDPNNVLVRIPFVDLDLVDNGKLQDWFRDNEHYIDELEKKYNIKSEAFDVARHIKSWIEYTYSGPSILDLDKQLIEKKFNREYKQFDVKKVGIHVRGKQIDHLDVERPNSWIHDIVLDAVEGKDRKNTKRLLSNRVRRSTLSLYMSMRDAYHKSTNGFAGFLDYTYQGKIMHEDIKAIGIHKGMHFDELLQKSINNPLRLHSQNLSSVISFLERFKSPQAISLSKDTMENFAILKKKSQTIQHKIDVLYTYIHAFECVLDQENNHNSNRSNRACLEPLQRRYLKNSELLHSDLFPYTTEDEMKARLTILFESLLTNTPELDDFALQQKEFLKALIRKHATSEKERIEELLKKQKIIEKELSKVYHDVSENITSIQSDSLTKHVTILPLVDNMFVSYMQQLLFIRSVRMAYLDLVACENDKTLSRMKKEERIISIIQQIFPVVEGAIRYVLQGGDYPWELRYKFPYEPLY